MRFPRFLVFVSVILSIAVLSGCKSSGSKPSNPFAQSQTVPPPGTFSSQEQYLGQTPGGFVPQTPATTYPPSGTTYPAQPMSLPAGIPITDATNSQPETAVLFASAKNDDGWQPVTVASTNHTAFQAIEAKTNMPVLQESGQLSAASNIPESVIVGTSHTVTKIVDDAPNASVLREPQPLYSGRFE